MPIYEVLSFEWNDFPRKLDKFKIHLSVDGWFFNERNNLNGRALTVNFVRWFFFSSLKKKDKLNGNIGLKSTKRKFIYFFLGIIQLYIKH